MSEYYFDSSALVKLYIDETGSQWVDSIYHAVDAARRSAHQISFARIGIVEVAAAIARRERLGQIPPAKKPLLYARFMRDSRERFAGLDLTEEVIQLAAELTQQMPLRGYDAVHLATALRLNQELGAAGLPGLIFVTADEQLYQTARQQSLQVDNPALHPN
ncbi:MAG: type II toxin-antitoxin system VapC family toxin [Anaerolineales bacterium]|nr:type II toxin-antitoxin system VapC family toxin [Anaerolineales bacterium]